MSDAADTIGRQRLSRALVDRRSGVLKLQLDTVQVAQEGERAGWQIVRLHAVGDRKTFLLECQKAFDLPDWFGVNWDALADSLSDVQPLPGMLVIWSGSAGLDRETRDIAAEVFADRAGEGPAPFVVVQLGREHT